MRSYRPAVNKIFLQSKFPRPEQQDPIPDETDDGTQENNRSTDTW